MASVNKVILVGNLGRDPEMRYMPSGDALASFSIATTDTWKDKSGQRQRTLQTFMCIAENRQKGISFHFQHEAVVIIDDGNQEAFGFVDGLQKMDDAELHHTTRKTGEVGKHHAPVFAKQIPDALVDALLISARLQAFLYQARQALFGAAGIERVVAGHGRSRQVG